MSKVTIFKNISDTTEPYYVDVVEIFKRIKDGNSEELTTKIRGLKTKDAKAPYKRRLPSICFSGEFSQRNAASLLKHSGLMCLDIDDLTLTDLEEITKKVNKDEFTFASFISPGGLGLKVIVKITPGKAHHKEQFLALEQYFNEFLNNYTSTKKNEKKKGGKLVKIDTDQGEFLKVHIDKSGKDVCRVCYESYDPNIYWNDDSEIWYECLEEIVEQRTIEDQEEIIKLLQIWIDRNETYYEGNRNNYLSKFLYAMCRYGVNDYKARDYLSSKFQGLPSKDLDAMIKSCYSKDDFNTQSFTEAQLKGGAIQVEQKAAKEITAFWTINEKGRVKIDTQQFLNFIAANGFGIYRQSRQEAKFNFVHVHNMVVDIVTIVEIKRHVLDYVQREGMTPVFDELQMKNRYFENTFLNALPMIDVQQIRDEKDKSFIFFEDFYYEITKDGQEKFTYIDLKGRHIWKSQICSHTITKVVPYQEHDFNMFVYNAMGKDQDKYLAACSALGYMIHTYKKKRLAKLVYACEAGITELDGMASGGTGKNLMFESLSFVRSVVNVDGKELDKRDKFKFQLIGDDTQIVNIDDYEGDIKELFTKITGHFEVEKKSVSKTAMKFEESPKIATTSNMSPKGFSDSFVRRLHLLEFSDHYSAAYTPADEFGDKDFFSDDWNQDDFNALYSFLFNCIRLYLDKGLIGMKINAGLFQWKLLVKNTGNEFAEYFKEVEVNGFTNGRELYSEYRVETKDDVTIQGFYSKIRKMCAIYGWEFEKKGRGIETEVRILKDK
ncbi:MAG: hypothetical protein IMY67_11265 [Bacteroidetes bacterium]|nr:hypothetical protein [Bacteroidota bacterium]